MTRPTPPTRRPTDPRFSAGPCAKRPGWQLSILDESALGRSHRAGPNKARLGEVIDRSRRLLGIPDDYRLAVMPGSDTGAFEAAMWSLLGARGVDVFAWESFGKTWVGDLRKQLALSDLRVFEADYGDLPDLHRADGDRDIVFTWNGTTSGVCVPDSDWIPDDRAGLTLCDATSAVFAMDLPWDKLDVVTWSWQKVLGGEAQHGMIALSPRAVARLESFTPPRPLPKIFQFTKGGKINEDLFKGATINTPSMLCVSDHLDALAWAEEIGGLPALMERGQANLDTVAAWAAERNWVDFLAQDPATRATTSICLKIVDPWFTGLDGAGRAAVAKRMVALLEEAEAGYDLGSYRDAPAGLRIWGGATVERGDIEALLPWLDWAFDAVKAEQAIAA